MYHGINGLRDGETREMDVDIPAPSPKPIPTAQLKYDEFIDNAHTNYVV